MMHQDQKPAEPTYQLTLSELVEFQRLQSLITQAMKQEESNQRIEIIKKLSGSRLSLELKLALLRARTLSGSTLILSILGHRDKIEVIERYTSLLRLLAKEANSPAKVITLFDDEENNKLTVFYYLRDATLNIAQHIIQFILDFQRKYELEKQVLQIFSRKNKLMLNGVVHLSQNHCNLLLQLLDAQLELMLQKKLTVNEIFIFVSEINEKILAYKNESYFQHLLTIYFKLLEAGLDVNKLHERLNSRTLVNDHRTDYRALMESKTFSVASKSEFIKLVAEMRNRGLAVEKIQAIFTEIFTRDCVAADVTSPATAFELLHEGFLQDGTPVIKQQDKVTQHILKLSDLNVKMKALASIVEVADPVKPSPLRTYIRTARGKTPASPDNGNWRECYVEYEKLNPLFRLSTCVTKFYSQPSDKFDGQLWNEILSLLADMQIAANDKLALLAPAIWWKTLMGEMVNFLRVLIQIIRQDPAPACVAKIIQLLGSKTPTAKANVCQVICCARLHNAIDATSHEFLTLLNLLRQHGAPVNEILQLCAINQVRHPCVDRLVTKNADVATQFMTLLQNLFENGASAEQIFTLINVCDAKNKSVGSYIVGWHPSSQVTVDFVRLVSKLKKENISLCKLEPFLTTPDNVEQLDILQLLIVKKRIELIHLLIKENVLKMSVLNKGAAFLKEVLLSQDVTAQVDLVENLLKEHPARYEMVKLILSTMLKENEVNASYQLFKQGILDQELLAELQDKDKTLYSDLLHFFMDNTLTHQEKKRIRQARTILSWAHDSELQSTLHAKLEKSGVQLAALPSMVTRDASEQLYPVVAVGEESAEQLAFSTVVTSEQPHADPDPATELVSMSFQSRQQSSSYEVMREALMADSPQPPYQYMPQASPALLSQPGFASMQPQHGYMPHQSYEFDKPQTYATASPFYNRASQMQFVQQAPISIHQSPPPINPESYAPYAPNLTPPASRMKTPPSSSSQPLRDVLPVTARPIKIYVKHLSVFVVQPEEKKKKKKKKKAEKKKKKSSKRA